MPKGNLDWHILRQTINFVFHYSELKTIFDIVKIEESGGSDPRSIYLKGVARSDIVLALFSKKIQGGQLEEIQEAKKSGKIIFGIYLNYDPFVDNQDDNHNVLYDVATINGVSSQYELLEMVHSQLLGYITRSIDDIKRITPRLIEEKLAQAIENDDDDLLDDTAGLIERVGLNNDDVFLMTAIYSLYAGFKIENVIDERLEKLAAINENAWLILLSATFHYKDEESFGRAINLCPSGYEPSKICIIFDILNNPSKLPDVLDDKKFQDFLLSLEHTRVFSVDIFENDLYEISREF